LKYEGLPIFSNNTLSLADFANIAGRIQPFVATFHLREKTKTARELIEGIELLSDAGISRQCIIVNDRVDVAAAMGILGVQLAYHSLEVQQVKRLFPLLKVGKSVHSIDEAKLAEKAGADWLIFGHIYPTKSKVNLAARGVHLLKQIADNVSLPIIAIGGINPEHTQDILQNGAKGIAVMSGILDAANPIAAAKAYYDSFRNRGR
jgi:thiazole tautomerase (transcriptional regulator TenI)